MSEIDPAWITALVALIVAVCGCIAWAARWAWRILRQTAHFLDDWRGQPERDGLPARPGVMARLGSLEHQIGTVVAETTLNGGQSATMRDAVGRIESDVSLIKIDQGELRRRMELFEGRRTGGQP